MTVKKRVGKADTQDADEPSQKYGSATDPAAKDKDLLANQDAKKKLASFKVRTISTVWMIGGFFATIYAGHFYLWCLTIFIQVVMVRELFLLAAEARQDAKLPGFRFLQWYFLGTALFFVHGRFVKTNLLLEITHTTLFPAAVKLFLIMLRHHSLISYLSYVVGFVLFVASLKKGMYLYQFGQYAWTHMILLLIVTQSSFLVKNIFEGLIWFVLPTSIIILNDIMAYLSGMCFGRTPLISLSPKKTWEGFIGAFFCTIVASYYWSAFLGKYKWMTCPRSDFGMTGFCGSLDCADDATYKVDTFKVEDILSEWDWILPQNFIVVLTAASKMLGMESLTCMPIQLHAVVLAGFASIIAPFGGFFASGFKRAFNIKDFGDSIPGHGGLTDRMDCQVVMAVFSYLYYQNVVKLSEDTYAAVFDAVQGLRLDEQLQLYQQLGSILAAEGLVAR
mmetsp:Transcript_22260/g.26749  ORF Transcript_22260/g.26749 Transcript_22260/m.26749 type:complete len:448 (-) Transcript_22260:749-2092(-)|eukprot:CAMPEP_0197853026 /NCGR_PEP_ID=MMETSP1438-20131217/21944_1 /TAXON_ID=1461541 /ORGANISM="Pterosperma sp., Strain CCMP1384" /LENGTH=447 /DNA_ID=CAMNT_0043467289 /DNA_START=243 /DNA_END=1586 /DNA_ORIENTATION=-